MATEPRSLRSMSAQIAALTRVARQPGYEISSPGRASFLRKFETGEHKCRYGCPKWDPISAGLSDDVRAKMVAARLSAHMRRLAIRSRTARMKARRLYQAAKEAENELAEELANLDNAS